MKDIKNIGMNIQMLRIKNRETQKELGKVLGKTLSTIQWWEHGVQLPRADMMLAIASHYGVDVDELYEEVK